MERLVGGIPWPLVRESLRLMRVDRPIGTWLVLWPTLWGLAAAQGEPRDPALWLVFILGSFVMRSAGCVANDLADRKFDPLVERTRQRPLAAGRISPRAALVLLTLLLTIALALALTLNPFTLQLAVGGAFLAVSYPFTKRFIDFPQFYMGAAFGWGVVMAWGAVTGGLAVEAWMIFAATLAWAAGYDTVYAMMDREDDLKIGVRSTAIWFGRYDLAAVGMLYLISLLLLAGAGWHLGLGAPFLAALVLAGGQMIWQLRVASRRTREACFAAFLSNRWLGGLLLAGFLWGGLTLPWL
ncbi:MAG: 4-hydroxybenzoate octaprenyltransferase [Magnetococcales bacterium]|nr:4-hydroxybenzoate octaprenyltransferase [Magnetococcales bacterium]